MEITRVPIDLLVPDPNNARSHPDRNLESIKASLEKFGQKEPLLVQASTSIVIGGNARLACMKALGWTEVDCVISDLSDADAKALGIALNRTAEQAEWNFEQLSATLKELEGLGNGLREVTGFSFEELNSLQMTTWEPQKIDVSFQASVGDGSGKVLPIELTAEQRVVFDRLVAKMRAEVGLEVSEGEVVEYLAGKEL